MVIQSFSVKHYIEAPYPVRRVPVESVKLINNTKEKEISIGKIYLIYRHYYNYITK
jgi:hypothetical protein